MQVQRIARRLLAAVRGSVVIVRYDEPQPKRPLITIERYPRRPKGARS